MVSWTLLASAVLGGVAAAAFGVVARDVAARIPRGEAASAARGFVLWWACLAAYLVLQGAFQAAAAFGGADAVAYRLSRLVAIPLLCAGAGGLSHYLLYLLTGRGRLWLVGGLYAATGVLFLVATFWHGPADLVVSDWLVELDYDRPGVQPMYRAVLVLVGLPPILGSVALMVLSLRLDDPERRYRSGMVGLGTFLWVGSGLAGRLAGGDLAAFLSLVPMGLLSALLVVLAYHPPAAVRRRLEG